MMISLNWGARWVRLVSAVIIGAIVYASFSPNFQTEENRASWWRPSHNSNSTAVQEPKPESKSEATESPTDKLVEAPPSLDVDWSQFAYTQYTTDSDYLCNSVMLFEILYRLGSRPDRVLMYPSKMMEDPSTQEPRNNNQRLLRKAADAYNVKLVPIKVQHKSGHDATWADSFTKLLAFNQTQYKRVLSLDSDSTVLQPMDELFLAPDCAVAMPRAYWLLPKDTLSSQVLLIRPDVKEFERIVNAIDNAGGDDYDMEIMNNLYKDSAMILPHRPYDMLTGEFRNMGVHEHYLGNDYERFDAVDHFNEAKFLHFSDWPVPKPWTQMSGKHREEKQPPCRDLNGTQSCVQREMWNGFYTDFMERRKDVCNVKIMKKRGDT